MNLRVNWSSRRSASRTHSHGDHFSLLRGVKLFLYDRRRHKLYLYFGESSLLKKSLFSKVSVTFTTRCLTTTRSARKVASRGSSDVCSLASSWLCSEHCSAMLRTTKLWPSILFHGSVTHFQKTLTSSSDLAPHVREKRLRHLLGSRQTNFSAEGVRTNLEGINDYPRRIKMYSKNLLTVGVGMLANRQSSTPCEPYHAHPTKGFLNSVLTKLYTWVFLKELYPLTSMKW